MQAVLLMLIALPPTAGVYPIVPPAGPLLRKSPEAQADLLFRWGFRIAGGEFKDDRLPEALRKRGIRTLSKVSVFQGERHWKRHPESRPIDGRGRPIAKDHWYAGLCPNQEWLRAKKLDQIERRLRSGRYDIVVLDFVQWPVLWQRSKPKVPDTCYCKVCLARFEKDVGVELPHSSVSAIARWIDEHERKRWHQWRADRITEFVHQVKVRRDRLSPKTSIGIAVVPWTDERLLEVAGQDLAKLAPETDIFLPMSYYKMIGRPVRWVSEVNAFIRKETKKPVWPIVLFDDQRRLRRGEWDVYLSQALRSADGLIAFPFPSVPRSPGLVVLKEQFSERSAGEEGLETGLEPEN